MTDKKTLINWGKISYLILLIMAFFLPITVLPFTEAPWGFSKSFIIYIFIIAAFLTYLIRILQVGKIKLPVSILFLLIAVILGLSLISSFFSKSFNLSVFGAGNEPGTFSFLLILAIGMYLSSMIFQSETKVLIFFGVLFLAALISFIFQIFQSLLGISIYPFKLFISKTDTLVGSWNNLANFFGLLALEAIVFFESFQIQTKWLKLILVGLIGISLLTMGIINFTAGWLIFGLILLVYLVYLYSTSKSKETYNFARLPLFVLLLVIFFVLARFLIGDFSSSLGLNFLEVRPAWSSSLEVAKKTLGENVKNLIIGSGPNTFLYDWLKFKPLEINGTIFWNTRFLNAIGLLVSFIATSGILGSLVWLAFLFFVFYYGLKVINFNNDKNFLSKGLLVGVFLGTAYLWILNITYLPGNFLFSLSFIMLGIFLGLLIKNQKLAVKEISFFNNTSSGFISALIVVLLMMGSVASLYFVLQKYWSVYTFNQGLKAFNIEGNLDKAQNEFLKAIRFDKQDRYYRALTRVGLLRISQILNKKLSSKEMRTQFQNALSSTIQTAQIATRINPLEPLNWMILGRVYESIIPFKIEGARQFALQAYKKASERDPRSPLPLFASARVEIQANEIKSARKFLNSSLKLKSDYTPALFTLAQLEAKEGNLDEAINQAEKAKLSAPNNIGVLFQLGLLYYQKKDYLNAQSAFERAIIINPNYSNARYFLGLIYDKEGKRKQAINQFEKIKKLNPDNKEVKKILANLKAGRPALENISPPQPSPEKRKEPPIREKNNKELNP